MKYCLVVPSMLMFLLLAAAGCDTKSGAGNAAPEEKVLVKVNGTPITATQVDFWLLGGHGQKKITPEMREATLEKLIELELMYQKGVALGLDQDKKFQAPLRKMELQMEAFKRKEMHRRVHNRAIAPTVKTDEEEARKYFDRNRPRITTELHLASLVFKERAKAEAGLKKLQEGLSFDELAAQTFPHAKKGEKAPWDLGFVGWSRLPAEWEETVYALKQGEVSEVVRGDRSGVRIFKLLERREKTEVEFDKVKNVIRNRLHKLKLRAARIAYLVALKADAKIEKVSGF